MAVELPPGFKHTLIPLPFSSCHSASHWKLLSRELNGSAMPEQISTGTDVGRFQECHQALKWPRSSVQQSLCVLTATEEASVLVLNSDQKSVTIWVLHFSIDVLWTEEVWIQQSVWVLVFQWFCFWCRFSQRYKKISTYPQKSQEPQKLLESKPPSFCNAMNINCRVHALNYIIQLQMLNEI